jgi:hypothetical protein
MTDHDVLREQIWDYVYGLLSDDESRALVARVKSDPQAARLYSEVRLQADLVGQASRLEDASLVLNRTLAVKQQPGAMPGGSKRASRSRVLRRAMSWLVGVGATALAVLLAVGFVWSRGSQPDAAARFVITEIAASSPLTAGISNQLTLTTYELRSAGNAATPAAAEAMLSLIDSAGVPRFQQRVQTSAAGDALVELPGDAIQPGVKLQVTAALPRGGERGREQPAEVSAELPVQEEPIMAYFLLGEPTLEPGKQVPFSAWNFTAFSARPAETDAASAVLESGEGAAIAAAPVTTAPQQGLVNGYLQAPANLDAESVRLQVNETVNNGVTKAAVASSPAPQQQSYAFSPYQRLPLKRGAANQQSVKQQVASQEPQQPPMARSALATGAMKADASSADQALRGQSLGGQSLGSQAEPSGTKLAADIPAGQPLELSVPPELSSKELQIAAVCRGVTVATATVGDKQAPVAFQRPLAEKTAQQVKLDLPPEADGLIDIEWFDLAAGDRAPVFRNSVYREPERSLRIDLAAAKRQFAPGERVQLTLQVRDEKGRPAADSRLGVRVWNEQAVQLSGEEPGNLADAVRNTSSEAVQQAGQQQQQQILPQLAQKPASLAAKDATEIGGQMAVGLATRTAPPAQPIYLVSNRASVEAAARQSASDAVVHRRQVDRLIGNALVGGGLVLLLLAAAALLLRVATTAKLMVPAGAIATASLVVGLFWTAKPQPATQLARADSAPATRHAEPPAREQQRADTPAEDSNRSGGRRAGAAGVAGGGEAAIPPPRLAAEPLADQPAGVLRENAPAERAPLSAADEARDRSATENRTEADKETTMGRRKLAAVARSSPSRQSRAFDAAAATGGPAPAGSAAGSLPGAYGGAMSRAAVPANRPAAAPAAAPAPSAAAPAALYFNPQLLTDAQGQATVEFTMPEAPAEYRLLIDALGQGRIGSEQMTIFCGPAGK